jgi:hypothetical protein
MQAIIAGDKFFGKVDGFPCGVECAVDTTFNPV